MRQRKTNKLKMYSSVLLGIALLLSACKGNDPIYDLREEGPFSQQLNEGMIVNYMDRGVELFNDAGWTRINKNQTRNGLFPESKLVFHAYKNRNLYLLMRIKPFVKSKNAAGAVEVRLNEGVLRTFAFSGVTIKNVAITLPAKDLLIGKNLLSLHYIKEKRAKDENPKKKIGKYEGGEFDVKEEPLESGKENKFSVVVHDLFLSSNPSLNIVKKQYLRRLNAQKDHPGAFIQQVPGRVDYYLNIPARSRLEADFSYYPDLPSSSGGQADVNLRISVQQHGGQETVLQRLCVSGDSSNLTERTTLLPEGITRLRLEVGDVSSESGQKGYLVWRKLGFV